MTDTEKLEAIEQALMPVYQYCTPGVSVPQNSKVFVALLGAVLEVAKVVPYTEPVVTITAKEYEEFRAMKAARDTVPVRR